MSIERVGRERTYPIRHHEAWEIVRCDNCKEKISDDPNRLSAGAVEVPPGLGMDHFCAECVALACPRCRSKGIWNFDDGSACDACLEEDDKQEAHRG